MKIQTINQLISVFKDIATRHYQINGFGIGDSWEIGADKAYMHPVLWINPTTANMPSTDTGYKTFEIDFDVRVFDLVHKDESNENEVLSDTIDILKDIITEFKGHPYYVNSQLNIMGDISFEAFTEEFDEEVSGWLCEISLMTPILTSFCGIPAADITGFEFPGVDCPDVNVLCPVFIDEILGDSPIIVTTDGTTRTISIDTSSLPDTFLTSSILNGTDLELTRNDGVTITTDLSSLAGGSVTLWEAGTGTESVQQINTTNTNTTSGVNSLTSGKSNDNDGDDSVILGGNNNNIINNTSANSAIVGGFNNTTSAMTSVILGGNNVTIDASSMFSVSVGGFFSSINTSFTSMLLGGSTNVLTDTSTSTIVGGQNNNMISSTVGVQTGSSTILGGAINTLDGQRSAIIAGGNNIIDSTESSVIIGGEYNTVSGDRSVIIGGTTITGALDDMVYVPNLRVEGGLSKYSTDPSVITGFDNLTMVTKQYVDSAVSSLISSADNGLNILGGVVELGGTLNKDTTISGASNDLNIGSLTSRLDNYNINSVEGLKTFLSTTGFELRETDNPGGKFVQVNAPASTTSFELGQQFFKTIYSDPNYQSTMTVGIDYNLQTNDFNVNSTNFDISPITGLITFVNSNTANEIVTFNYTPTMFSENITDGTKTSNFITTTDYTRRDLTNGVKTTTYYNSNEFLNLKYTNTSNDIESNMSISEFQTLNMIADTSTSRFSSLQLSTSDVTLNHTDDTGSLTGNIYFDDTNMNINMSNGTSQAGVNIEPSLVNLFVSSDVSLQLSNTNAVFYDNRTTTKGIEYNADYSTGFTNRTLVDKQYVDTAITNITTYTADYCRGSKVSGNLTATYATTDQIIPITIESENSNSTKFTVTGNGIRVNQAGRYRVNTSSSISSLSNTARANPIVTITVNDVTAVDANGQAYQSLEHYGRNAGSSQASTSQLDIILDLSENDIVKVVLEVGGINGDTGVVITSQGTHLEVSELVATQGTTGFTGTYTNGDGNTVTVTNGIITNIV